MEVPDDVTLLFADDNWGNIRRLPELDAKRDGGYGIYYHFDYVGGLPPSYLGPPESVYQPTDQRP